MRKYRWAKTYEAGEAELISLLEALHIDAERWDADLSEVFDPHTHPKDKKLWCAEGSITFTSNGKTIPLQAGDALDVPANTIHSAIAGFMGCVCYEYPHINDNPIVLASE